MGRRKRITKRGLEGFVTGAPVEVPVDGITLTSKNLVFAGRGKMVRYPGQHADSAFVSIAAGAGVPFGYLVGGVPALQTARGMAAKYRGDFAVFTGDAGLLQWQGGATLTLPGDYVIRMCSFPAATGVGLLGLPIGAKLTEDATPPPSSGQFSVVNGTPFAVGNKIKKTVSLKYSFYRTSTRGEGWTSAASDYVVPTGGMGAVQIFFPGLPAGTYGDSGNIKIRLYSTLQGFPEGPHYLVRNPADADGLFTPNTLYPISWNDGDLGGISPYSSDSAGAQTPDTSAGKFGMPPKARFVTVLGPHVLAVGTDTAPDGHIIRASAAFHLETFDPDAVVLANPAEPFLGVLDGAADGYIVTVQRNGIGAIILTGSLRTPVLHRNLFAGIGAESANQVCSVYGELYVWALEKGLVRGGPNDLPDSSFTERVREFLSGFTSPPILRYDTATDRVVFFGPHSNPFGAGAASCGIAYERGLPGDLWTAPFELNGQPYSGLAYADRAYGINAAGGFYRFFPGAEQGVPRDAVAQYLPTDGGAPGDRKCVMEFDASVSHTQCDVLLTRGHANASGGAQCTHAGLAVVEGHSDFVNSLLNFVRSFSARVTLRGNTAPGIASINHVTLAYEIEDSEV